MSRTGRSPKDVFQRFLYDLEMKTRERSRTEIERFDWFIERIQTRVAFGWLSERSGEKTFSAAGLAQSVERLTAGRKVAGSIPGAEPILRALK